MRTFYVSLYLSLVFVYLLIIHLIIFLLTDFTLFSQIDLGNRYYTVVGP